MFLFSWPIVLVFVVYVAVFGEPAPKTYASDGPNFKCSKKDLIKQVDPVVVEKARRTAAALAGPG